MHAKAGQSYVTLVWTLAVLVPGASASGTEGPVWVAELSDATTSQVETLEIWLPAGEYTTVGIYNTDTAKPQPPKGISADVTVVTYMRATGISRPVSQRFEPLDERPSLQSLRTPNAGALDWRQKGDIAPLALSPPKFHKPTGTFAVRLRAESAGDYAVPIRCDRNTVTVPLHVTAPVPRADMGFGFYADGFRYNYPEHERLYLQHMAEYGCNTIAAYGRPTLTGETGQTKASGLARALDLGIEVGLIDKRFAVLCLDADDVGDNITDVKRYARHFEKYPELVGYNYDEPRWKEPEEMLEWRKKVQTLSALFHEKGFRSGTALVQPGVFALGDLLDIWIVGQWDYAPNNQVRSYARKLGAEVWVYDCYMDAFSAPAERYYTGLFSFRVRPGVNLKWTYMDIKESRIEPDGTWKLNPFRQHAVGSPDGPLATVGLVGWREGIVDYRVLQELERLIEADPKRHYRVAAKAAGWLQELLDSVPMSFRMYYALQKQPESGEYERCAEALNRTNFGRIRRQALEYIKQLSANPAS